MCVDVRAKNTEKISTKKEMDDFERVSLHVKIGAVERPSRRTVLSLSTYKYCSHTPEQGEQTERKADGRSISLTRPDRKTHVARGSCAQEAYKIRANLTQATSAVFRYGRSTDECRSCFLKVSTNTNLSFPFSRYTSRWRPPELRPHGRRQSRPPSLFCC